MSARRIHLTLLSVTIVLLAVGGASALKLSCDSVRNEILNDALAAADETACAANLSKLYRWIVLYKYENGVLPAESGPRFIAVLYLPASVERSRSNAMRLSCPAVDLERLSIATIPWEEWWSDLDSVDSTYTAYAGRNVAEHPLPMLSGSEPLIACDNEFGMNHGDVTHVLYGDGSIHALSLSELKENGVVDPSVTTLSVGRESPLPDLRKLLR